MAKKGHKYCGRPPAKMKQVRNEPDDKDETSDEEGRLSAEESTVAGTLSPTLSCSAPSIDPDAEGLSDDGSEDEHQENGFQSLKQLGEVDEPKFDGFYLVGRRLAGLFAKLMSPNL